MPAAAGKNRTSTVAIVWDRGAVRGDVEVVNGQLAKLRVTSGKGKAGGGKFAIASASRCRLDITVADAFTGLGAGATIVTVNAATNPFSFFLRDAVNLAPLCIPDCGAAVVAVKDKRTFAEILDSVRSRGGDTVLQKIESEPEETYANAAAATDALPGPMWLGVARDMRIFEFNLRSLKCNMDYIAPRNHGFYMTVPDYPAEDIRYYFMLGRGWSCSNPTSRRLEDGVLPILNGCVTDDDVNYNFTTFVTLEKATLTERNVKGTHYLVADAHGPGNMHTPEQKAESEHLKALEMKVAEQPVMYFRAEAVNTSQVPRYAWFLGVGPRSMSEWHVDERGFGRFDESKRVFATQTLDGKPMLQKETAVLLGPGESVAYEFRLPHQPIETARAAQLAKADFDKKLDECRQYWRKKLSRGAALRLPEKRIDEMAAAGLLHLDIVAYGREPDGPIAATIGAYCPIGSESSPIIRFFDSMGWGDVAERALEFFLCKQKEDGFIQNFGEYMLETGPAVWSMVEHYRYTRDKAWARRVAPKILKACDFMIKWRHRDKTPEGFALAAGKTADPKDPFHSFMLNGYAYLGISRAAEMLADIRPADARRLAAEAEAYRKDIRDAFFHTVARSPVVPLGDGTWIPSCPPWTEDRGPVCLFAKDARIYTHGSITARDSLLGPIYLIFQEVLDPAEPAAAWLLNFHAELMCKRNVAFSQPYYSRHPWAHLARGEVKAFLKAYYNGLASLADRETYSWWEHYFHASPHKTHEEGWFLMQTRWMLYMERGDTLRLLPGVPRAWLEEGKTIELRNVATYFGPMSLKVKAKSSCVESEISCPGRRRPKCVEIRIPHPKGCKPSSVTGGKYCKETETVRIDKFTGSARVTVKF